MPSSVMPARSWSSLVSRPEQVVWVPRWDNPLRCSAVITNRAGPCGGRRIRSLRTATWSTGNSGTGSAGRRCCFLEDDTSPPCWFAGTRPARPIDSRPGPTTWRKPHGFWTSSTSRRITGRRMSAKRRRLANRRLSRAFLNRSHEALRDGQIDLARTCLHRAWALSSGQVIRTLGTDPRLCAQMATLAIAPRLAQRWFGRDHLVGSRTSTSRLEPFLPLQGVLSCHHEVGSRWDRARFSGVDRRPRARSGLHSPRTSRRPGRTRG